MPLSPTEQKVLALYDQGKSYKEICVELGISVSTLKTHAEKILVKTTANCLRHAAYVRGGPRIKASVTQR